MSLSRKFPKTLNEKKGWAKCCITNRSDPSQKEICLGKRSMLKNFPYAKVKKMRVRTRPLLGWTFTKVSNKY
jgi:hypothetical protein